MNRFDRFLDFFGHGDEEHDVMKLDEFDKQFFGSLSQDELKLEVRQAQLFADRAKLRVTEIKTMVHKAEETDVDKFVAPGRGQDEAPIVAFVGSSPSKIDFIRRRPFSGLVGKTMTELYLDNLGLTMDDVYFTNIVKEFCFDEERHPTDPSAEVLAAALPDFVSEMQNVQPRFIVALGKTAKSIIGEIAEEWVPHPRAINMNTDSGEVERKMKRLAKKIEKSDATMEGIILKSEDDKQIVYGVVMEPMENDTDDNWTTADQIESAAHLFMKSFRQIDTEHNRENIDATPVENWIQHEDTIIGGQTVKAGSWVMGVKIEDPEQWASVKAGEYSGFSIDATTRIDPTMLLQ